MKVTISLLFLVIAVGFLIYLKHNRKTPNKVIVPLLCLFIGIFVTLISYESFTDFNEDIRSEIIGMLIEIGVIYLLIDLSLEVDRKRERKEKEMDNYFIYLEKKIINLLYELEKRYLSLFNEPPDDHISEKFLKSYFLQKLKWEVFTGNSDTQSYNHLFRDFAAKEVEKLILLYHHVMPTNLLRYLLRLDGELQKELEINKIDTNMLNKNYCDKVEFHIFITLRQIASIILGIHKYTNRIKQERHEKLEIELKKLIKTKGAKKRFINPRKPIIKDKNNNTLESK